MRAFNKLSIANFKQFFRDRTALFFTFAFPILFMVIFGLVFSGGNNVSYDIAVVNQDTSPVGAAVAQAIEQVPIFKAEQGDLDSELDKLRQGDLRAVIQIPTNLQDSISQGATANITVYYDPAQTTSAQVILPVLQQVIDGANRTLTQSPVLLQLNQQSIQAHELRNIDYLVPGILAMSILFLGLFGAMPMVEWREKQVLKRFGATPLRRSTIISSQVAYRLVLAVLQTLIIVLVGYFAFRVQIIGNWLLLLGLVILGTLTLVSIGYLAASRAKTVESAMPIIQLIQFPMLFLSGIFFPIEIMPDFIRPLVLAMPITYLADALRQVMVSATPLYPIIIDVAVMAGWLVVSMLVAVRLFRWE